jgi:hypothetical protein
MIRPARGEACSTHPSAENPDGPVRVGRSDGHAHN